MNKRYAELDFTDDFMFCKILYNNPEITKELLELILRVRIARVVFPEKQKQIELTANGRGIRLDVYLEGDDQTVYDMEMQTTPQGDLAKRTRYYQGMIDLNLIERGAAFRELKKTYIIFICLNDPFSKGRSIYTFENRCNEDLSIRLEDDAYKVFINPAGDTTDLSEEMKEFFKFLKKEPSDSPLVNKIRDEVYKARRHKEWEVEFMTLLARDQMNQDIGRAEGRAEGLAEGGNMKLYELVSNNMLSLTNAAESAGVSVETFKNNMLTCGFNLPE